MKQGSAVDEGGSIYWRRNLAVCFAGSVTTIIAMTLAASPGEVLTRERLLAEVWGWDGGAGATRTVDSHVKALRAKIGAERVRTVHGVGYALEAR